MKSAFLTLSKNDFARGAVIAVLAAVLTTLAQWFNAPGFDFASFQWDELFKIASIAFVTYLSKNLLSDESGRFGGIV